MTRPRGWCPNCTALGVPTDDVSFVAHDFEGRYASPEPAAPGATAAAAGASIGVVVGGGAGLLAGIGALTIPGIGPVVAAGWLASTLAGAGVVGVAGGLLGALVGMGLQEDEAQVYADGVRRGGAVVAVRVEESRLPQIAAVMVERAGTTGRTAARNIVAAAGTDSKSMRRLTWRIPTA